MKYLLVITISLMPFLTLAQEEQDTAAMDSIPWEMRRQAYMYNLGKKYNDPIVTRMALYNLIVDYPGNTAFMDTLALFYLDYQQFASAALVAKDVLALDPDDLFATEIAAISFERIGLKNRAVEYYEKLYTEDLDISILYRVAFLQLDLKRYEEAMTNANIIEESPKAEEIKIVFPVSEGKEQEVSLKASAVRLKGMIEQAKGNKEQAKAYFNQALELQPGFAIVKSQLEQLSKE